MTKQLAPIVNAGCMVREGDEYSFSFCSLLTQAVEGLIQDRRNNQGGIFTQPVHDLPTGRLVGNRIMLFSGKHVMGIALATCPFCGGALMGAVEKAVWSDLIG